MTTSTSSPKTPPVVQAVLPDAFPVPLDLEGHWMLDPVHAPRPLTPLSQEILVRALSEGFRAGQREAGYPLGMCFRAINAYAYAAFIPHEPSAGSNQESPAWDEAASAALTASLGERSEREWLPAIQPGLEHLRTLDYRAQSRHP
jgi:hypothetical protein